MKASLLTGLTAFAGYAAAFYGQLSDSPYNIDESGQTIQSVYLTDYNTGSQYWAVLVGGFNACTNGAECLVYFEEYSGGYNFDAFLWRTEDGCHNINFLGALSSGHGYCCGSLPCEISA